MFQKEEVARGSFSVLVVEVILLIDVITKLKGRSIKVLKHCPVLAGIVTVTLILTTVSLGQSYAAIVYETDFSSDPGWLTNNTSKFYWYSEQEMYHYRVTDAANEYAYITVPYPGTSFCMEFDVLPTSTEWCGNSRFGLGDQDMDVSKPSTIFMQYHWDSEGWHAHSVALGVGGVGGGGDVWFYDGIWYRNVLRYDAIDHTLDLTITLRDTGEKIRECTLSALGDYAAMDRLYISSKGDSGCPGQSAEGYIDNVVLSVEPVQVAIDIKPGSDPNCFNNDGNGVIPVAVLGSADFDVTQIDASTVRLEGMAIKAVGKSNKLLARIEDVNGDGIEDLIVQIADTKGVFSPDDTMATVTGNLLNGIPFEGSDTICIVGNPSAAPRLDTRSKLTATWAEMKKR